MPNAQLTSAQMLKHANAHMHGQSSNPTCSWWLLLLSSVDISMDYRFFFCLRLESVSSFGVDCLSIYLVSEFGSQNLICVLWISRQAGTSHVYPCDSVVGTHNVHCIFGCRPPPPQPPPPPTTTTILVTVWTCCNFKYFLFVFCVLCFEEKNIFIVHFLDVASRYW